MSKRYTDHVSDEPLDIIRANECESQLESICTNRFRRLWNEIVGLQAALEIVGPPDGKIDLVALVAEISAPELLREALLKVRAQRDEYKRQADGYYREAAIAYDKVGVLERAAAKPGGI